MNRVAVSADVQYVPERSDPSSSMWFYAYTITIRNEGKIGCQLLSRHWIITDATGHVEEVRGPGVVGQQPYLEPGESFSYTSACPLRTPVGSMRGSYQMVNAQGEHFDAPIPAFVLTREQSVN
ncbi:MAG: Co2+/Mg2+ efflux protein ApaG [Myxococcales bacterium]|nr:Co2+/Mg2+ efflux protein ApaG [Myxococcales bacterium]